MNMKNFSKVFLAAALVIGSTGVAAPDAKACGAMAALGMAQSDFTCETFTGSGMTRNNRTALNYCNQNGYNGVESYGDNKFQCKGGVSAWGPTFNVN